MGTVAAGLIASISFAIFLFLLVWEQRHEDTADTLQKTVKSYELTVQNTKLQTAALAYMRAAKELEALALSATQEEVQLALKEASSRILMLPPPSDDKA